MMKGLRGKRVLITGGAKGIGRAAASRFIREGSRVFLLDKDAEACSIAGRDFPELLGYLVVDVTDRIGVLKAMEDIEKKAGGLDVLVNNAGISIRKSFTGTSDREWMDVMRVNLHGVFIVAQEAVRLMEKGEGGVILNMGSTNALSGYPLYAAYNASKAGVVELTRTMALELAPRIRVNAVCPGYILTPMQKAEYTPEMLRACEEKVPLKRLGTPEEVASLMAFLASEEARFITGQCFIIDGGELAGGLASQKPDTAPGT